MSSPCPRCRSEARGPYPDGRYHSSAGAAALAELIKGYEPYLGLYTYQPEFFAPCKHMNAAAMKKSGFFSAAYLSGLVGPADGARLWTAFEALVTAVRVEIAAGQPCPTCGAGTFVRDGELYARMPSSAFLACAREIRRLRPLRPPCPHFYASENYLPPAQNDGYDLATAPFFTEGYLYTLLNKDDARSVLYRINALLSAAGVTNTWQYGREQ